MNGVSNCCGAAMNKERKGPHAGLYCAECGQWQRWEAQEVTIERARVFAMPFGKYKGKRLEELPQDYLVWMAAKTSGRPSEMAQALLAFQGSQPGKNSTLGQRKQAD